MTRTLVIPAAGRGSRLGLDLPKALVPVAGRPMLDRLFDRYLEFVDRVVMVVAPPALAIFEDHVRAAGWPARCVVQPEPNGMLPAILCAAPTVSADPPGEVWITWCDQVGISRATVARLAQTLTQFPGAACVFPTVRQTPPYIHFVRDEGGRITGVLQRREGDTMPPAGESDAGLFGMRGEIFIGQLEEFHRTARPGSGTNELNFLPFLPWLSAHADVRTFTLDDPREAVGINTPDDLRAVEALLRARI